MRKILSITMSVILNALAPRKWHGTLPGPFNGIALPGDIPRYLANLGQLVGNDGKLGLFIPGCAPLAAPFLLFRLKREGYSSCCVTAAKDGLRITARR
jgi:hypothetical protein